MIETKHQTPGESMAAFREKNGDLAERVRACMTLAWGIKELAHPDSPVPGIADHLWGLLADLETDLKRDEAEVRQ